MDDFAIGILIAIALLAMAVGSLAVLYIKVRNDLDKLAGGGSTYLSLEQEGRRLVKTPGPLKPRPGDVLIGPCESCRKTTTGLVRRDGPTPGLVCPSCMHGLTAGS